MNGRETFFVLFFEIKGRKVTSVEKGAQPILRRNQLEKNRKIRERIHDGEKRSLTGKRRSLWMRRGGQEGAVNLQPLAMLTFMVRLTINISTHLMERA